MDLFKWCAFSFLILFSLQLCSAFQSQQVENSSEIVELCPQNLDIKNYCNYRDTYYYYRAYWNYWSGYNCYLYTSPERFKQKLRPSSLNTFCNKINKSSQIPIIGNSKYFATFDYKNSSSMEILKTLFKSEEFFLIFLDCLQEAEKCCFEDMTIENIFPSEQECSVVWDAWSCFPRTPVNTTKKLVCSKQAYSSLTDYCTLESEKVCFFNETTGKAQWIEQTDYNNCAIAPVYKRRHKYNVITLHICNVVDVPAILIFLLYRKLRQSTRMSLHRNLLIAIVIRNVLTIMTKELIIIDQLNVNTKNVMGENGVPCRVLAFFENVFKNAIFACMVIDGYYLHKQIVRNHAPEPKKLTLSLVSVVLSLVPSLIWATLKGVNEGGYCWMVDSNNEQWTGDGFRILVLIINILILVDIIRIIFTRMRHGGTSRQTKAALKSTLFLIPLFGLQFLVTAKKMVLNDTCVAEDAYEYTKYSMEAFQGIMVAILFCYASSEVHVEINNTYRKVRIFLEDRFGIAYNKGNIDRRATTATFVGN